MDKKHLCVGLSG